MATVRAPATTGKVKRIEAARRAWLRLPAGERANLLQYMREEADEFETSGLCDPPDGRAWARVNRAAIKLIVAVAGEPKPRANKAKRKSREGAR